MIAGTRPVSLDGPSPRKQRDRTIAPVDTAVRLKATNLELRNEVARLRQQQLIARAYASGLSKTWAHRLLWPLHAFKSLIWSRSCDLRDVYANEHLEQEPLAAPGTWGIVGPQPSFTIPRWLPSGPLRFDLHLLCDNGGELLIETQHDVDSDRTQLLGRIAVDAGRNENMLILHLDRPALALMLRPVRGLDRFRFEMLRLQTVPRIVAYLRALFGRPGAADNRFMADAAERELPTRRIREAAPTAPGWQYPRPTLPLEDDEYPIIPFRGEPTLDWSVIIPTVNDVEQVCRCISTCREHLPPGAGVEFIVIDDGTRDAGLRRQLGQKARDLDFTVCFSFQNLGFSASVNLGMQRSRGRFLVLCNNDIVFHRPWLDAFREAFHEDSQVGIVGARLLYPDGKIQHAGIEKIPHGLGWLHSYKRMPADHGPASESRDVWAVTGALLALRRETVEILGGLSTAFAMAHEDVDYCLHAWCRGIKVRYRSDCVAYHAEGATRGASPEERCQKPLVWAQRDRLGWEYMARKWSALQEVPDLDCFLRLCNYQSHSSSRGSHDLVRNSK